ncbi:MAG: sugar transferase [Chloroflexi bacterium HGW-Chloroflexi-6]|nr:MAG: sugar transferase [Chloroflexi bacterium HGW-Chloroflexi-6]
MLQRFSSNTAIAIMLLDILLVVAGMKLSNLFIAKPSDFHLLAYFVFPLVWWAIFLAGALYDGKRNLRAVDEISTFIIVGLFAGISLAGLIYLNGSAIKPAQFNIFIALTTSLQLLARIGLRVYWHLNTKNGSGNGRRRVLIIGAGDLGRRVQNEIQKYTQETPVQFVGFVDDSPYKLLIPDVLGVVADTPKLIMQYQISDVVITLPAKAHKIRKELVTQLNSLPVRAWVIPDIFRLALHQPKIETFAGMPMLDVRAPGLNEQQRLTKRIFDLLISLILLSLSWPLLVVIGLLIRRDSPGPAIFRQVRVGEHGQPFMMYKFRTMVQEAESLRHLVEHQDENGNMLHKSPTDPRITRIGHFLRRTSLDELPQLINVLIGDMSLVGPRPELPHIVQNYQPWQHARLSVPPGITGWWQVNGRSDKPMHLHTEDDIYYVQNCSIWLDIQILLKTILVVVLRKGAY